MNNRLTAIVLAGAIGLAGAINTQAQGIGPYRYLHEKEYQTRTNESQTQKKEKRKEQEKINEYIRLGMRVNEEEFAKASDRWKEHYVLTNNADFNDPFQQGYFKLLATRPEFDFKKHQQVTERYIRYLEDFDRHNDKLIYKIGIESNINILNDDIKSFVKYMQSEGIELSPEKIHGRFISFDARKSRFALNGKDGTVFTTKSLQEMQAYGFHDFEITSTGMIKFKDTEDKTISIANGNCDKGCNSLIAGIIRSGSGEGIEIKYETKANLYTEDGKTYVYIKGKDAKLTENATLKKGSAIISTDKKITLTSGSSLETIINGKPVSFEVNKTTEFRSSRKGCSYDKSCVVIDDKSVEILGPKDYQVKIDDPGRGIKRIYTTELKK